MDFKKFCLINTDKSKNIFTQIQEVNKQKKDQDEKAKKKLLREKYDFLIQMNINMHGRPATVQNSQALAEIKNLISQEEESAPRNITEYHKYMTRQMQLKPAPFATYSQNCDFTKDESNQTTTDIYTPKCKEMNDFIKDVKANPCRYLAQQKNKFQE